MANSTKLLLSHPVLSEHSLARHRIQQGQIQSMHLNLGFHRVPTRGLFSAAFYGSMGFYDDTSNVSKLSLNVLDLFQLNVNSLEATNSCTVAGVVLYTRQFYFEEGKVTHFQYIKHVPHFL